MILTPNNLGVVVNTVCNRRCPDCCYQIPTRAVLPPRHEPWASFERAARFLRGVEVLYVSGGEPTLHPEFDRIAREFRTLFDAGSVILVTNGARVVEHGDVMRCFDVVRVTAFDDPLSQAAIAWLRERAPENLQVYPAEHLPIASRPGTARCGRNVLMAYALERLYPCCEGPGIVGASSIELSDDWPARLAATPLPCRDCFFACAAPVGPVYGGQF